MTNMKDATLTASKVHVNPPFRQTVRVERFPASKMDTARAAYYNRSPALTNEEKYQGVAAAQRRKQRAAGTLSPSARAAQARIAAGQAAASRVDLPARATDRLESKDARPRAERSRTDALRPHNARTAKAGTTSQPTRYAGPESAPGLRGPGAAPDLRGPAAAPDFRRLRKTDHAAATAAPKPAVASQRSTSSHVAPVRPEVSAAAAQPSQGSFASSFHSARSFFSRLPSGTSRENENVRPNRFAKIAPKRGLLGWLSRWFNWF